MARHKREHELWRIDSPVQAHERVKSSELAAFDGIPCNLDASIFPLLLDNSKRLWRWSVVAETALTHVLAFTLAKKKFAGLQLAVVRVSVR